MTPEVSRIFAPLPHSGKSGAAQPWTRMNVRRVKSGIEVETVCLDQLDIFASGHPAGRPYRIKQDGKHMLKLRARKNQMVEIVGFAQGAVRQRRRILQ
jgi:hypothetical protein